MVILYPLSLAQLRLFALCSPVREISCDHYWPKRPKRVQTKCLPLYDDIDLYGGGSTHVNAATCAQSRKIPVSGSQKARGVLALAGDRVTAWACLAHQLIVRSGRSARVVLKNEACARTREAFRVDVDSTPKT
ncbi:hypothetical protein BJV74DRAFT_794087 [Russula compacta]|nr:hypothetical protein BJV74DRAFT_794087 [Russula compacta]